MLEIDDLVNLPPTETRKFLEIAIGQNIDEGTDWSAFPDGGEPPTFGENVRTVSGLVLGRLSTEQMAEVHYEGVPEDKAGAVHTLQKVSDTEMLMWWRQRPSDEKEAMGPYKGLLRDFGVAYADTRKGETIEHLPGVVIVSGTRENAAPGNPTLVIAPGHSVDKEGKLQKPGRGLLWVGKPIMIKVGSIQT